MNLYTKALEFAAEKHAGNKRKNGDNFIIHPIRVSQEVKTETQKAIALLHDILEDTETTYEELKGVFGVEIAHTVLVLTKTENETYEEYIERVRTNPDAVAVKIADIADNLSDTPSKNAIIKSAKAITELVA